MIIYRGFYRIKSSVSAWREKLAETLNSMGYLSTKSDPDVWFKQPVMPSGEDYYKYIILYVDVILHLAHYPKDDMDAFNCTYILKEDIIGTPKKYLGDNVEKF